MEGVVRTIRGSNMSLAQRAWNIRRKALLMGEVQGQGYIGQALGIADVLAASYFHALEYRSENPEWEGRDRFLNTERPHQALDMACPAERYSPSPRPYRGLPDLDYPFHDKAVAVTTCARITHLLQTQEDQPQPSLRRPDRRHQTDRRPKLVDHLHGLRSRVLR